MDHSEATQIVELLYRYCLKRDPATQERETWANVLEGGVPVSKIIEEFGSCAEFKQANGVEPSHGAKAFFPLGHYYSPIVNPDDDVRQYMLSQAQRVGVSPYGIDMMVDRMKQFFMQNGLFMATANFSSDQNDHQRYYFNNGGYPLGDAVTLRAMINHLKPNRIIEVGSGFSTACMLDTLDEISLRARITCIEPDPERLRNLLRPNDDVEIIESPVQKVDLKQFSELGSGDILFIDSTHVMKTGSDVHFELFEILPRLREGVIVHFHDILYPFEYPTEWVFERNFSWNEAYAIRSFLMYNETFRPYFSSSLMVQYERGLVDSLYPGFPSNPGTNIWIKKER